MIPLIFHTPRDADWPICRMLLPAISSQARLYECTLAVDESQGAIAGAAAFIDHGDTLRGFQLHTVRGRRREGIGSQLLQHVSAEAARRGRTGIAVAIRPAEDDDTHAFLLRRGFEVRNRYLTAEGDLRETFRRQCARSSRLTTWEGDNWRILPLSRGMLRDAGKLHAEYLSGLRSPETGTYFVPPESAGLGMSQVLEIDGSIEGIALLTKHDDVVTFEGRIVRPQFRHGRAGAALFLRALQAAVETGATRLRFSYMESTADTAARARRLDIPVVDRLDLLLLPHLLIQ